MDTVLIPHPYVGLTARLGTVEINVHDVKGGLVYYGRYEDGERGTWNLYRKPVDEFTDSLGRSILDGAAVFSLLETAPR